jgi:LmbE family N-acetylglucosaminyl deacetylase
VPDTDLTGHTVLGVFAHPDDESLACGGTLARLADAGARVVLLCASRGRKGSISDRALVPDDDLGRVRAEELQAAADILGVAEVMIFDHPDGDLRWADQPQLLGEIMGAIRRLQPQAVITFAEDGLYWHLDHVGVHERTFEAVTAFGADAPPLYYVTMPSGSMRGVADSTHATGGAERDSSFWGITPDAFGAAAHPPTFVVDVRPWVPRKLAALRRHRTQFGPRNPLAWIDDEQARRWLGVEHFRRAPIAGRGDTVLEAFGEPMASP